MEWENHVCLEMATDNKDESIEDPSTPGPSSAGPDQACTYKKKTLVPTSAVWKFFEKNASDKAKCNLCGSVLKTGSGNTSNLKHHLQAKHKTALSAFTAEEKIVQKTRTKGKPEEKPKQHILDDMWKRKWTKEDSKKATKVLAMMICQDLQPYSIVEDKGFRNYSKCLQPYYILPCRKSLLKEVDDIYDRTFENVCKKMEDLHENGSLSLTIDGWTSNTNSAFLAITGHFIDTNFCLQNLCLDVKELTVDHTGKNIAAEVRETLNKYNINPGTIPVYCLTDNASNYHLAMRLLREDGVQSFPCLAHTLQLVIDDDLSSLRGFQQILSKARAICSHYHKSTKSYLKFQEFQRLLHLEEHKLIQDVKTRWNSTYYMIERLVEQKAAISSSLPVIGNCKLVNLSADEWVTCEQYVKVLRPFEEVTRAISGATYPTVSLIVQVLNGLVDVLNSNPGGLNHVCESLKSSINRRCGDYENNPIFTACTLLDPRLKDIPFEKPSTKKVAKDFVLDKMILSMKRGDEATLHPSENCTEPESVASQQLSGSASKSVSSECSTSVWKKFKVKVDERRRRENATANLDPTQQRLRNRMSNELTSYLEEPVVLMKFCAVRWWRENLHKYPNVARVARSHLSIPATSVPCEHMFSKTAEVISKKRNRLKNHHAAKLIYININT